MHKPHSSIGSPQIVSTKPFTAVLAIVAVFCNSQPTMTYPYYSAPGCMLARSHLFSRNAFSFLLRTAFLVGALLLMLYLPLTPTQSWVLEGCFIWLFYINGATIRRELPLDVCKIFRARDRARKFRFCVMSFSEVFRARCRFASRINSSKTSEYVKQPISICKSLQTIHCLLELEHGYGCSEILPGLLAHLHVGKTARRFERTCIRQRAYYFGV